MNFDLGTYREAKPKAGLLDIEIQPGWKKRFSDKKKEMFYRDLGMLLRSGVDFRKALEILANQTKKGPDRDLIAGIKDGIIEGRGIHEAMMSSGKFSPYEYYSVQIGEETRKLEEVLHELQLYFNRRIQMRRQIVSVLTYPAIVLAVTFMVLYFMLTQVVPMFSSVFRQFGSELPKSTRYIIALSNHAGMAFGSVAVIVAALVALHYAYRKADWYRGLMARITLRIPYFGKLLRKIYLSRFCQSMKLLTKARMTLISSLSLTSKMIGFLPIEKSLYAIREDITRGASLSESLRKHSVYENKMVSMIEVAEQVNELDIMFERLCDQYTEEINHQTKMIGVVLEPLIIIVIGLVVGVIMISMYAPMFDLSKIIHS